MNILVKTGGENNFSFNGNPNLITSEDFNIVPNTNGEWKFASIVNPSYVEILQNSNITNSTDFFHVGIIMGRESSSRYGYFSNYNTFVIILLLHQSLIVKGKLWYLVVKLYQTLIMARS